MVVPTSEHLQYMQDNLVNIRKFFGWSQRVLGQKIGTTSNNPGPTISEWERHQFPIKGWHYYALWVVILENVRHYNVESLNKLAEILKGCPPPNIFTNNALYLQDRIDILRKDDE